MKKRLSILLVLCMLLSSCAAMAGEVNYTYDAALSVFPTNWNVHTYQTNDDSIFLDYTSNGFYKFDYNDDMDGYKMVPDLATDFPIDVTAEYVGQYGITEDSEYQAYIIPLRDDIKWQDGTPITANDIVESTKRLLNPAAANYRADSTYQGNMIIYNAKNYAYQGQHAYSTMISTDYAPEEYVAIDDFILVDGALTLDGEKQDIVLKLTSGASWDPSNGLDVYYGAYPKFFQDAEGNDLYVSLLQNAAVNGQVKVTKEVCDFLCDVVARLHGYDDAAAYAEAAGDYAYQEWEELAYVGADYPEIDFSEVGYFAKSDYELVVILEKPLTGFYLLYNLTSNWLVKNDLYDACESLTDGVYSNKYGTSAENYMSYGPYMLTEFQSDKVFVLEKNPYWYGWNKPENEGFYQTDRIIYNFVAEPATRLEMFLNGKLDSYGLQKDNMETYATSDYTYYSEGESIFAMAFNPNMEALTTAQKAAGENINKTILTIKEFRMAMSMAMNRAEFCLATSPTNYPAYALYSSQIIADPENGIPYRSTDEAKQALVNFWGLADEIGEGKMYWDLDEAIDSITGYNLEMAKQYFDAAYDLAIELGLMDEDDVVQICVGTPNMTSTFYNNGYDYIVNNYTEAVKGTKLEGKLTFTRDGTLGNAFGDALRYNNVDMLFGVGWIGSTFDPFNLMQVYVDPEYQYDSSWDSTTAMITIELDGEAYTANAYDWYLSIQGVGEFIQAANAAGEYVSVCPADDNQKIIILAALENCILQNYDFIPLTGDATASLKSMQIEYYTEDEIFPMGRGGVTRLSYNYTDAEWEAFVASQGGTLNYK